MFDGVIVISLLDHFYRGVRAIDDAVAQGCKSVPVLWHEQI